MEKERDSRESLKGSLEEVIEAMKTGKALENVDNVWSRWDSWAEKTNNKK